VVAIVFATQMFVNSGSHRQNRNYGCITRKSEHFTTDYSLTEHGQTSDGTGRDEFYLSSD